MGLPSRLSAPLPNHHQTSRNAFLIEAKEKGFAVGYSGIRVRKDGSQFTIRNAALWNLYDGKQVVGQAALLPEWE